MEEKEFFRLYQIEEEKLISKLSEVDNLETRQILVERNLRLVVYIAKKFENTGIGIEDLISIGTIGLMKGVNTFNSDKNINLALKIVGIVCVAIVIAGLSFILIFSSDSNTEIKVPDNLIGLSEKEACAKIEKKDLVCKVQYVYDKDSEDIVNVESLNNNPGNIPL